MGMEKNKVDYYDQKIDIALKKKELKTKYGADFGGESDLPPEVEGAWLDHMIAFEEQFQKGESITVWKYMGEPEYRQLKDLIETEIPAELDYLFDCMDENNLNLDTICEVEDRELYRFITEELFAYEMDNIRIPGMMTCFIYEEFHPNAELDIRNAYDDFFATMIHKRKEVGSEGYYFLYVDRENFVDKHGASIPEKVVKTKLNNFLDSFDYFEILSNKTTEISINQDKTDAILNFELEYQGCFDNIFEKVSYKGRGIFRLRPCEYGGWEIYHIDMPGFKI